MPTALPLFLGPSSPPDTELDELFIPDDFAGAAAGSGLGTYDTNLLIVADGVPAGTQVLTNSAEHTLTVVLGEPSAEPPSSSVPTTEP